MLLMNTVWMYPNIDLFINVWTLDEQQCSTLVQLVVRKKHSVHLSTYSYCEQKINNTASCILIFF